MKIFERVIEILFRIIRTFPLWFMQFTQDQNIFLIQYNELCLIRNTEIINTNCHYIFLSFLICDISQWMGPLMDQNCRIFSPSLNPFQVGKRNNEEHTANPNPNPIIQKNTKKPIPPLKRSGINTKQKNAVTNCSRGGREAGSGR